MIALTTRLNERDETIIQLQEELDAYDRIHHETDEMLQFKNLRVDQLESILKNHSITVPSLESFKSKGGKKGLPMNGFGNSSESKKHLGLQGKNLFFWKWEFNLDNLMDDEQLESINENEELRQICEDQKNEIIRLQKTLHEQHEIGENKTEELGSLQNEYQEKINTLSGKYEHESMMLQGHLKNSEENNSKLLAIIRQKEEESKSELKPPQIKQIKSKGLFLG